MYLKENPTLEGLKAALKRKQDGTQPSGFPPHNSSDIFISNELIRYILLQSGFTNLAIHNFIIGGGWYDGLTAKHDTVSLVFSKKEKGQLKRYDKNGSLQETYSPTQPGSTIVPITSLLYMLEQPGAKDNIFEGLIRLRIMHDMEKLKKNVIPLIQKTKSYLYLSPQTFHFNWKTLTTEFLLNPLNQDKYQHGWYTVQELILWANDRGPVLKKRKY